MANLFYMFSEVPRECFCFSVEGWYEIDERRKENDGSDVRYDDLHEGWQRLEICSNGFNHGIV